MIDHIHLARLVIADLIQFQRSSHCTKVMRIMTRFALKYIDKSHTPTNETAHEPIELNLIFTNL